MTVPPGAPGFSDCAACPYLDGAGSIRTCYLCVIASVQHLPPVEDRCKFCDQAFDSGWKSCGNRVCRMSAEDRWFEWNLACAVMSGSMQHAIVRYKAGGEKWRARVFARLLVGYLDRNGPFFVKPDFLIPTPTYTGEGAERSWDHVGTIVETATRVQGDGRWPFRTGGSALIVKTAPTARMRTLKLDQRQREAETNLRAALWVPNPSLTEGKTIVVFDDVFTGGWTLREVARALKTAGGAAFVYGLSLARQPWSHPSAI
jgi:predicted amidophosphoribosyltransferase